MRQSNPLTTLRSLKGLVPFSISGLFSFPTLSILLLPLLLVANQANAEISLPGDSEMDDAIIIVEGEDKTVYEYRSGNVLILIKVVPKDGRPYYMVPADGSPHYADLDQQQKLYPRWVILEW